MRKIIVFLAILLSSFLLISCSTKTNFQDLSKEEQAEIQAYYVGKVQPVIGEMFAVAFDASLSDTEKEKKNNDLLQKAEEIFEEDLKKKYSNVEFGSFEDFDKATENESNSDNEIIKENIVEEDVVLEVEPEFNRIDKNIGDLVELNSVNIKILSAKESNTIYDSLFEKTTEAKNGAKFVVLDVEVTNITKAPFWESFDDMPLIDNQDRQFLPYNSIGKIDNYLDRDWAPSITENGNLVYELPIDSEGYYFRIGKAGTNDYYYIKLK